MKILSNMKHLTGSVLAVLACATVFGCSRNDDASVMSRDASTQTTTSGVTTAPADSSYAANDSTTSNTTIAANETTPTTMDNTGSVPPAPADEAAVTDSTAAATTTTESTTHKKSAKHSKAKHKAKKHHKRSAAIEAPVTNDEYVYDSTLDTHDSSMTGTDDSVAAVDASRDFEEDGTTSATTSNGRMSYYETGLSPFAQEPSGRIPTQIGSGQLTGEDRSTTVLDGPSLFQDPSALGRDIVH